jgi:competence protein ComEC
LNDHSLALLLRYRDISFFIPTDMSSRIERQLLKQLGAPALRADLLIAPHHGSKSSSSPEFLDAVQPRAAIFSARPGGWYQMPHPQVIERFRERRIRILRTDRDGAVTVRTDGQSLEFETAVSPETAGTGSLF